MDYSLKSKGDWTKTFDFLKRAENVGEIASTLLTSAADKGVEQLTRATPKDTGKAASSWRYEIKKGKDKTDIFWLNDDVNKGYNVIILLNYGHGTGTGGYVKPNPFINPIMKPIYKAMADTLWKEVIK